MRVRKLGINKSPKISVEQEATAKEFHTCERVGAHHPEDELCPRRWLPMIRTVRSRSPSM